MGNTIIPESVANHIAHEYKWTIINELWGMVKQLEANIDSGDVVTGRRRALLDAMHLLEERNWYRTYNLPEISQMRVSDLEATDE